MVAVLSGEGEVLPGLVPVAVEVGAAECCQCGGAGAAPVHAGAFESQTDELFRRGLHHAAPHRPAPRAVTRVIRFRQAAADVITQLLGGSGE